jgi:cytidylate kinase
VTISRQAGCGAHTVAEKLAQYLGKHEDKGHAFESNGFPVPGQERRITWTVFDRELVEKVLADHHLPKRLADFMPEDRVSQIEDIVEELFGLHPPFWLLIRQMAETILRLVELGHVILIGRGANVITSRRNDVLHVRLVASLEKRVARIQARGNLEREAALKLIRAEDRGRGRYLRKYFHQDIDDPFLYHLIVNTDLVSCEDTARIIGDAVLNREESPEGRQV